jgi:sphingomyelin phosphodiesterase
MSVSGREGHLFCAAVGNSCPYPDVEPYTVTFPKEKPADIKLPEPSGDVMTVLQLSDWHVDPDYQVSNSSYGFIWEMLLIVMQIGNI